jgi:hydrogenase maturation protein HypF
MARRQIAVSGIVQGVGFRPFVHQLATRLGLGGFVCNQHGGVRIEVEGIPELLDDFVTKLSSEPPPLAKIHRVACVDCEPRNEALFCIKPSEPYSPTSVFIGADVATPSLIARTADHV